MKSALQMSLAAGILTFGSVDDVREFVFLVPDLFSFFFPVFFWSHFSYGKKLPYMKNKSRRSISCQNFQSLTQIQRF